MEKNQKKGNNKTNNNRKNVKNNNNKNNNNNNKNKSNNNKGNKKKGLFHNPVHLSNPVHLHKEEKKLKVIPLGGLNEIGKNITAFELSLIHI